MDQPHTIVIGGGLAGLTAAATLTRAGRAVTVLEGAEHLGGRARTRRRDGYDLNLGPHALYRAGGGLRVLRRLGVRPAGRIPRVHRAGVLVDGRIVSALAQWRHLIDERGALVRAMTGGGERTVASWSGRSAEQWLGDVAPEPAARALLASFVRTATYTADHALLDAGAAIRQLRAASHGVLYLHHGWSTLVDGLADVVRAGGGEIRTRAAVAAIDHDDSVRAVRLADGQTIPADAVVVAVTDSRRIAGLLNGPAAERIIVAADAMVPVHMAHLDVALRPGPPRRFPNVLGLDCPVYLTVPSDVADVAPAGGAVIHVGRYLRPDEVGGDHRASLEAMLDIAYPEWRDDVVNARFVPRSTVCGDHARVATRGTAGRVSVSAAGVGGLAIAGDWVGPEGTLADASILSGEAAVMAIMEAVSARPFANLSVPSR